MRTDTYAVIMAGGRGERFWPLSTERRPKQLLSLIGGKTLMTAAVDRLKGLIPPERILVITNADLVEATAAAAPALPPANIIGEPFGRDTAAAVALASTLVQAKAPKGAFCVLTADQIIGDLPVFRQTLADSFDLAMAEDVLLTIGITPGSPSTGFGYIEAGAAVKARSKTEFLKAKRFVEKPDARTARKYIQAGSYYWNSGMFIWSVESLQLALRKHRPPLYEMARRLAADVGTPKFAGALKREYGLLEKISVDYALMEKADNIVMAKGTFAWDDVGSWPALENHFRKDKAGNIVIGSCENIGSANNVIVSDGRLTALIGVKDMVVVQAEGATLICPKDRAQEVKALVQQLKKSGKHPDLL